VSRDIVIVLLIGILGCRSASWSMTKSPTDSRDDAQTMAASEPGRSRISEPPQPELSADPVVLTSRAVDGATGVRFSLSDAISLALAQNPDLVAQRQAENVGTAALGVAETYPFNPYVQVQATPFQDAQQAGPGTTYHYVLLMQTIQLAHQQEFREAGAAGSLNSIRWNIHQAELLNVAQTERLYFAMLYQRGLHEVADALHANNRQLLQTLERQLAAGGTTAADVALVRLDTRSTEQQTRLAEANYQSALRDLRRQLGMDPNAPFKFAGDLMKLQWRMPGETIEWTSFAAARPDVMAAHADIDTARAGFCLASAAKTPDLQVGPYYQRTTDGTSFLGFRAQMDIPVINTGQPLEAQRHAELNQRATAWQQLSRRAELEATAAWERYSVAYTAVETNTTNVRLPEELQKLEEQFRAGEVDVLRIVQSRISLIQNQRTELDLRNELAQSAAALTAASGLPVEALLAPPLAE